MHLRLLLQRIKPMQLKEFHILSSRENMLETIPGALLGRLAGVNRLSLPAELIRATDAQDFIDLWQILDRNIASLHTLYLSGSCKYGEISGDLLFLRNIDPVFRTSVEDILPRLLTIKTNIHLTSLRHLRIRGIANLQVLRSASCEHIFNLYNLETLRLDSCAAADDLILQVANPHQAPSLRSLQLFDSCCVETLNKAIPMLQPLETLYLFPYRKSYAPVSEKLSFKILENHRNTLKRVWLEDPEFPVLTSDNGITLSKLEISLIPKVEEISVVIGDVALLDSRLVESSYYYKATTNSRRISIENAQARYPCATRTWGGKKARFSLGRSKSTALSYFNRACVPPLYWDRAGYFG
ncbi:hypothetical protein TWF718_007604 [Orbilia javanica]|uniref:Uncharacterized protein n=1 Tax=Orbilia javanica TaxID=47235 RepID=A0AAN8MRN5_9PEZI